MQASLPQREDFSPVLSFACDRSKAVVINFMRVSFRGSRNVSGEFPSASGMESRWQAHLEADHLFLIEP
jgi:hypothetical protein